MKILQFADLHGHNFKEFSYIRDDGINSRLYDQIEVLNWVRNLIIVDEDIKAVVYAGDLTHLKNNVDSQVIEQLCIGIDRIASFCPIFIIPGNHDYRMWGSDPALLKVIDSLGDNISVLDHGLYDLGGRIGVEKLWIYASPYTRRAEERNTEIENATIRMNSRTIFVGHQDIKGVNYGGHVVERGLDPDMLSNKFVCSFIGHCHDTLVVRKNVFSIGAPLEHNFGDEGKDHGLWTLEITDTGMYPDFRENKDAPKFHTLQYGVDKATVFVGDPEKDFYRVILDGVDEPDEVKSIRYKRVIRRPSTSSSKRTTISLTDSTTDIIEKYVETRGGTLDHKKLVEIGRGML